METVLDAQCISKSYTMVQREIEVLKNVSITIQRGEYLSIMGPSGSGKSTLMNLIGCLDKPSQGNIFLEGQNLNILPDAELSHLRATKIGFVFQTFNLIYYLNVFENVELPFLYSSFKEDEIKERVTKAIEEVGLSHRIEHKPFELSGGEMQRVAIARAIAVSPSIILADEPTGNLDSKNSSLILEIFKKLNDNGATIVLVTHDKAIADNAKRAVTMMDGQLL